MDGWEDFHGEVVVLDLGVRGLGVEVVDDDVDGDAQVGSVVEHWQGCGV